ncbi:MAG: glutamine-hydrolyzing GMP synthase [Anaerolineae bacterium]|nr:glutamine-hydrolyzing GMP synthase [Thermoflexales bacterium]MDW8406267.1 glutamine-hydrolyzing GMP synthase [Anaerolineae bacterium]
MTPHTHAIAVLDFGSQYSQLIARRVRETNVYCELFPWDAPAEQVMALQPHGFILSGGPNSVYEAGAPTLPPYVLASGLPVLGICYGMQLLAHALGGRVVPAEQREYGQTDVEFDHCALLPLNKDDPALPHSPASKISVWMSHGDRVEELPPSFRIIARSVNSPIAGMADEARRLYAIQFHPEVQHTQRGREIISHFVHGVCGCPAEWTPANIIEESVARIRAQVGDRPVICGLSGGVDSSVTAALVHRAVGDQLTCVFVDTGLLRKGEAEQVVETFQREQGMRLIAVNAAEEFLDTLQGVTDPEEKRKRIGEKFIRVFEAQITHIHAQIQRASDVKVLLAQGTLYPDVIESRGPERQAAAKIKTHHNVGGLPKDMRFELLEPLRYLFKDEVRAVGSALGLPNEIVWRQPFPGPGLAVRVLGEVTWDRLERLRAADAILQEELRRANLMRATAQAFAVLLPVRAVGVMGDGRTYNEVVAIRAVTTDDFMTADWARLPYDVLARISSRIVNEVAGVNRVTYDITTKPPATIEWE